MNARDLLPLVLGNLQRMKGRVVMTALGVVIGTAALVVLVSLGAGLERLSAGLTSGAALTEISFNPPAHFKVVSGAELDGMASQDIPNRCGSVLDQMPAVDGAMREQFAQLPGVEWVAVYENLMGTADIEYGALRGSGFIRGMEPSLLPQLGLEPAAGTLELGRGEAVVGAGFAAELYDPALRGASPSGPQARPTPTPAPPPDLLGQTLIVQFTTLDAERNQIQLRLRVRVVGILAPRGYLYDPGLIMLERDVLEVNNWMHAARAGQRRDPARQGYSGVVVRAVDLRSTAMVEEGLTELGFPVYTERRQLEEWSAFFTGLQVFLGIIGAISLVVAAFGISNTMLMAVTERTREIGLMKAVGASNRDVVAIFLAESGGIGVLGGVGGVAVGLLMSGLLRLGGPVRLVGLPSASTYTPLWLPFFTVGFAVVIGLIAGAVPASRAARLVPIVALKYE